MALLYGANYKDEKDVKLFVQEIPAQNFTSFALTSNLSAVEHWINPSQVRGKIDAIIWQVTLQNTGATAIVPSTMQFLAHRHDTYFNGVNSGTGLQVMKSEDMLAHLALVRQEKKEAFLERAGINVTTYLEDTDNPIPAGGTAIRALNLWDFSLLNRIYVSSMQSAVVHKGTLRANPQVTGSAVDGKLSITDSRLVIFSHEDKQTKKEEAAWKTSPVTLPFTETNTFVQTNCKLTAGAWTEITLSNITGHVTACYLVIRPLATINTALGARTYTRMETDKYDNEAAFDIVDGSGKSVFGNDARGIRFNELLHVITAKNLQSSFLNKYPGAYLIPFGNSLNDTLMNGSTEGGIHMDGLYRLRLKPSNAACNGATDFHVELHCHQPHLFIKDARGRGTSKKL